MDEHNRRHCPVCAFRLSFHAVQRGEAWRENSARRRAKRDESVLMYIIRLGCLFIQIKYGPNTYWTGAGMFPDSSSAHVGCQEYSAS